MLVCETERLTLWHFSLDDAPFVMELVMDPSFIHNIRDTGVRDLEGARGYIEERLLASYAKFGFGLYLVALKDGTPIGMCGLVKRDGLDDADIGYALLPRYWAQGYAHEAARAVMAFARDELKLPRVVGITDPDNQPSARLLEKLGLKFDKIITLPNIDGVSSLYVPAA